MLHSHVKIWVHLIWTTHNRVRVLHKDLRIKLFHYLIEQAKEEGIALERLNVQPEHVHCLFTLPSDKSLASVVKTLKGTSSHWINEQNLIPGRFRWQRGYGAFSVSASLVNKVKRYIENQEVHHKQQTFKKEYEAWKSRYGTEEQRNR